MSVFDLLFLFSALATIVTLATALVLALAGRRTSAAGIFKAWAAAAAVYLAADILSHAFLPLAVVYPHDPQCSDDWCSVVEKAGRDAPGSETYRVALRIYSRALRVPQRERDLVLYLTDSAGRRYDPDPQAGDVPFDTLLQPGESAVAMRTFRVPPTVRRLDLSLVKAGGGFPIGALIIGRSPFDRRTVVRLE